MQVDLKIKELSMPDDEYLTLQNHKRKNTTEAQPSAKIPGKSSNVVFSMLDTFVQQDPAKNLLKQPVADLHRAK